MHVLMFDDETLTPLSMTMMWGYCSWRNIRDGVFVHSCTDCSFSRVLISTYMWFFLIVNWQCTFNFIVWVSIMITTYSFNEVDWGGFAPRLHGLYHRQLQCWGSLWRACNQLKARAQSYCIIGDLLYYRPIRNLLDISDLLHGLCKVHELQLPCCNPRLDIAAHGLCNVHHV